uniref:Protein dpy-30 homolog n=2 Tax=Wuchereria bancrofti TaxID=6293 RepID=A0A1I8ERF0_WUCBA
MANSTGQHCTIRRLKMSAMEVTETPAAESEQMKEQVEEMHQQKVEEARKEEIPAQDEATKAVDSTLSHPSATTENIESGAESEKKDAPQTGGESGSGDTATTASTTIPTRQYLDQTVVPILLQALGALAKERPPNPIEYLANYLLKEKDRFSTSFNQQQQQNESSH